MKDLFTDNLKVELKWHFKDGLPENVKKIIEEGEKEFDEQNPQVKIMDEFGFLGLEDLMKEDLARDDKEDKKPKALRKEKRERRVKSGAIGALEAAIGALRTASAVATRRPRGRSLTTSPAAGTGSRTRTRTT